MLDISEIRWKACGLFCVVVLSVFPANAGAAERQVEANRMVEFLFTSEKDYDDPFNSVELTALFRTPQGQKLRVPAFWAGGRLWKIRYASAAIGVHTFRTECSDTTNGKLHGASGRVDVLPYRGNNPLYRHGPIRVAADHRHFEHADGVPFFWLGDTWWMGLCQRLRCPEDFQILASDRKKKGFNVVQIVAGLYPDMPAFDPRGANEAGFPWTKQYTRIRPEYFDQADRRLQYLADEGFVPCIVGAWGYHLPWLGTERMKKHWRYIVARYAALPVVWCAAGEVTMPWYLSAEREKDVILQKEGWTAVCRHIHEVDPFRHPLTLHPSYQVPTRASVTDPSVVDFELLQTGHGMQEVIAPTGTQIRAARAALPAVPVIDGEPSYENLNGQIPASVCRALFWTCVCNGAAGHTYGANGIWQVNCPEHAYGASPGGHNWGTIPWSDAMKLPGSGQVAAGKALLMRYEWWRFEPHAEWAAFAAPAPTAAKDRFDGPLSLGIPGKTRLVYVPKPQSISILKIDANTDYRATYFDPVTGKETRAGEVQANSSGMWYCPPPEACDHDWLIVLERLSR
jgi:hypothetical protein